jgi:hypothetical protein
VHAVRQVAIGPRGTTRLSSRNHELLTSWNAAATTRTHAVGASPRASRPCRSPCRHGHRRHPPAPSLHRPSQHECTVHPVRETSAYQGVPRRYHASAWTPVPRGVPPLMRRFARGCNPSSSAHKENLSRHTSCSLAVLRSCDLRAAQRFQAPVTSAILTLRPPRLQRATGGLQCMQSMLCASAESPCHGLAGHCPQAHRPIAPGIRRCPPELLLLTGARWCPLVPGCWFCCWCQADDLQPHQSSQQLWLACRQGQTPPHSSLAPVISAGRSPLCPGVSTLQCAAQACSHACTRHVLPAADRDAT